MLTSNIGVSPKPPARHRRLDGDRAAVIVLAVSLGGYFRGAQLPYPASSYQPDAALAQRHTDGRLAEMGFWSLILTPTGRRLVDAFAGASCPLRP